MNGFKGFLQLYFKNESVRVNLSLALGIILNGFYVIFNLSMGILYSDAWLIAVAAYYMLILSIRYIAINGVGRDDPGEVEYTVGTLMLVISAPIIGMMIYNVLTERHINYPGAVSIVLAFFSAISIIRAIHALVVIKRKTDHHLRIAYSVRTLAATMSFFNLQSTLVLLLNISRILRTLISFATAALVSVTMLRTACRRIIDSGHAE